MAKLTVQVVDKNQNPAKSKRVYVSSHGGPFGLSTGSTEYTNSDGVADFDYVPTGTNEIYVDGQLKAKVSFSYDSEHKYVVVNA